MLDNSPSGQIKKKSQPISVLSLALLNTALSMAITYSLLQHSGETGFVNVFQFVSHFLAMNLVVCLVLFIISLPFRGVSKYLGLVFYWLLQIFLFVDVKIYELFHFHFFLPLWNEILTEGFSDSVTIGQSTFLYFFLIATVIFLVESIFVYASVKASSIVGRKLKIAIIAFCFLIIAADKIIYAFGNMYNVHSITRAVRLYPLYQPLKADKTISKLFKLKVKQGDELKMSPHGSLLNYPKYSLIMGKGKPVYRPNIIMVVVEGFRYDMLDPETTPNLWRFSKENITFKNHYSGGNGTRAGVFSLFYGLQGTYWHSILIERKPPVLLDSLLKLDYEFKVLSSTKLTYPEFRKTAFVQIAGSIEDKLPAKGTPDRDKMMVDKFVDFLSKRNTSKPFFSAMFFDSSHQPYTYPKDFEKFKPVSGPQINYGKETNISNIAPIRNRYKNALYYNDFLFGKIFASLKEKNLLKNSIVVITGDHGEEFYEQGYFGHTGSFDDFEAKVVFVMHMPGMRKSEVHKLTSHLDFVPTVMKTLGYINPVSDYSQGIPLFDKETHPYVFSAGWDRLCMIDENEKIVFSTETYRNLLEVFDSRDYKPAAEPGKILKQKKGQMADVLKKMSEFYK
jgi:membrane-anchored protein YejM (alkaline phosphatase superfamily)